MTDRRRSRGLGPPDLRDRWHQGRLHRRRAKTVIPAQETAKVSLDRCRDNGRWVGRALGRGAACARVGRGKGHDIHGGAPVQVDVNHAAFQILNEAYEAVEGRRACRCDPVDRSDRPELALSGAPVILTASVCLTMGSTRQTRSSTCANSGADRDFGRFFELFAEKGGQAGAGRAYSSSSGDTRLTGPE